MNTYSERQISDATMDLRIAVEHLIDADIMVAQERFSEAAERRQATEVRIAHASRVLGTTIEDVDDLWLVALKKRCQHYPAVAALFPHHAGQEGTLMTTPEEKEHAENAEYEWQRSGGLCIHGNGEGCMRCWEDAQEILHPGWNARLAAHMAAVVTRAKRGTIALGAALLLASTEGAHATPLVPTDGECALTHTWEDGSATALCGHDTWAYDADGGFAYLDGMRWYYRDPGTWYQVS